MRKNLSAVLLVNMAKRSGTETGNTRYQARVEPVCATHDRFDVDGDDRLELQRAFGMVVFP